MNMPRWTKATKNGFRWFLSQWVKDYATHTLVYYASAQKRCTEETRSGGEAVYYRYIGQKAEFDTTEDRDAFVRSTDPEAWAVSNPRADD